MAILFRILLLLAPVVALILWLRWRAKKKSEGGVTDEDVKGLQKGLIVIVLLVLAGGIGIRMTDTSGSEDGRYVPARVENGKLIPGRFVDDDETEEEAVGKDSEEQGEDGDDSPS